MELFALEAGVVSQLDMQHYYYTCTKRGKGTSVACGEHFFTLTNLAARLSRTIFIMQYQYNGHQITPRQPFRMDIIFLKYQAKGKSEGRGFLVSANLMIMACHVTICQFLKIIAIQLICM